MSIVPVAIAGAGPLGLALALALQRRGITSRLFEARPAAAAAKDARVLALSHGSRQLLEMLGAWPAAHATAIRHIHISQRDGLGHALMHAEEMGLPALGYVLRAESLIESLRQRVETRGIAIDYETGVEAAEPRTHGLRLQCKPANSSWYETHALLLARCEGTVSEDAPLIRQDYAQHALLCRATPVRSHGNQAWERFTSDGPIALLPFEQDYAVVWTVPEHRVDTLLRATDAEWLQAIQAALPAGVKLSAIGNRAHYPLGLRVRRATIGQRQVWLGNAAQTLHPVAGQGFNLALRDAWELADTLTNATDPGTAELLTLYARSRRIDRWSTIGFTDFLVRSFSTPFAPLKLARGLGLVALDTCPPLRHFLAKRMIYGARAWP